MKSADEIDLLLVDDHALFRESMGRLLSGETGSSVVAHCGSIEQAITVLRERHIDLVLLDFTLRERDGLDFWRLTKQDCIDVRVLIVTAGLNRSTRRS